ncbi:MetQ/NlpA family ABC transporter substrate-binding protein [Paeniglutamicibacter terrestris]|uniref:MetQ/NlpA family ABC transporter substrate-binding protein n=1 Tax=Paeniglutamicibacter terrestris TaxID=2723403 RepID=UPI003CCA3650
MPTDCGNGCRDLQPYFNYLASTVALHIEPFGAYTTKFKALGEVAEGSIVAVPNDLVNADARWFCWRNKKSSRSRTRGITVQ